MRNRFKFFTAMLAALVFTVMTGCTGNTIYKAGKTFQVDHFGENGKETFTVKTGIVKINGKEVENCVSAREESDVAAFLILMYSNNLDYMKLCSKKLDKSKVDKALSEWKSTGGGYVIAQNPDSKSVVAFYGGSGSNIWDIRGKGEMKVETIREKVVNYVSGDEIDGKYVITDIEFNK
jgi:hypothetical protein